MYLAHVAAGLSYTEVGREFRRDRTTVAHACAVVEDLRDDPTIDRAIELLELVVHSSVRTLRDLNSQGQRHVEGWNAG
jgi:hypothetical protein